MRSPCGFPRAFRNTPDASESSVKILQLTLPQPVISFLKDWHGFCYYPPFRKSPGRRMPRHLKGKNGGGSDAGESPENDENVSPRLAVLLAAHEVAVVPVVPRRLACPHGAAAAGLRPGPRGPGRSGGDAPDRLSYRRGPHRHRERDRPHHDRQFFGAGLRPDGRRLHRHQRPGLRHGGTPLGTGKPGSGISSSRPWPKAR